MADVSDLGPRPCGDLGTIAAALLTEGNCGRVEASTSSAIFIRMHSDLYQPGIVALVGLDQPRGPVSVRLTHWPLARTRLSPGVRVRVVDGGLQLDNNHRVPLPTKRWVAKAVSKLRSNRMFIVQRLEAILDHEPALSISSNQSRAALTESDVTAAVRAGLPAAVGLLAGRGSGLTPAGDDVFTGIILATSLLWSAGEPTWSSDRLRALVRDYNSHDISKALVAAAANGQGCEPLHDLLDACSVGDEPACTDARKRLARWGETSGLDMAYGVMVGLREAEAVASDCRGLLRESMNAMVSHSTV